MLSVKCPSCSNEIKFSERLPLIYKFYGACKSCNTEYIPNKPSMLISSAVLGGFLGILIKSTFDVDILSSAVMAFILTMGIQQLINPFYSVDIIDFM